MLPLLSTATAVKCCKSLESPNCLLQMWLPIESNLAKNRSDLPERLVSVPPPKFTDPTNSPTTMMLPWLSTATSFTKSASVEPKRLLQRCSAYRQEPAPSHVTSPTHSSPGSLPSGSLLQDPGLSGRLHEVHTLSQAASQQTSSAQ